MEVIHHPSVRPSAPRARRVLVVDDSRDVTDALAELVEMLGHTACRAHDGPGALAAAAAFRPDIVICDIGLPGMSGVEVCARLRAAPGGAALVIVALSGWDKDDPIGGSRGAGFDRHLTKPIGLVGLREVLALHPEPAQKA